MKKYEKIINRKPIKFSVIVPIKKVNEWVKKKLIPSLKAQTYKNWEVLIVTDKDCPGGPAQKRDWAAEKSQGELLVFIDSDAYAHPDWLKNALKEFKKKSVAGVCGPGLVPPKSSWQEELSGWVWKTWLGAGEAASYRCQSGQRREVYDYPTFNLFVRKSDFLKVGGFNCPFWPGEDTKLCHDLVHKLTKKIIYTPQVKVFHQSEFISDHFKRIWRFGVHRGHFTKIYPKTSFRFNYLMPSLFLIWLLFGWIFGLFYLLVGGLYLVLLLITSLKVFYQSKNFLISLALGPMIFFTHVVYGLGFLKGLLTRELDI